MKGTVIVIIGLLCLATRQARSEFLEEANQAASAAVLRTQQALTSSQARTVFRQRNEFDFLSPEDAWDETKIGIAAKFISIQPGEFKMGSPSTERNRDNDEHQHTVKLTKGFEIQAADVTQLQYFLVTGTISENSFTKEKDCDANNYKIVLGKSLCINHPVENVSWYEAVEYANAVSKLKNLKPCYVVYRGPDGEVKEVKLTAARIYDCEGYRLPTEAEREYAARAGTNSPYSFGPDAAMINNYAWYAGNSKDRTHAVAVKKANPWGLYDVHGNVWTWAQDFFDEYYGLKDIRTVAVDPEGPATGLERVIRGGSWSNPPGVLRSAFRFWIVPESRYSTVGFRLVRPSR